MNVDKDQDKDKDENADADADADADAGAIDLHPEARRLAEQAAERLRLSARGFTRVLRVARTVADLGGAPHVRQADVAEALAFRHRVPGRAV